MAKQTFVELYSPELCMLYSFEIGHATRILRDANASWVLPENSKYEFADNELKLRTNKRKSNESE